MPSQDDDDDDATGDDVTGAKRKDVLLIHGRFDQTSEREGERARVQFIWCEAVGLGNLFGAGDGETRGRLWTHNRQAAAGRPVVAIGPLDGIGVNWQQCPSGRLEQYRPAVRAPTATSGTRQPDVKSWIITVKRDEDGRRIDGVALCYRQGWVCRNVLSLISPCLNTICQIKTNVLQ